LLGCFLAASVAWGSASFAATPKKAANDPILLLIRKDLSDRKSVSFDHLLSEWEEKFGAGAVPSLIHIASDRSLPDPDRYIALMGSAKLGGEKVTGVLLPFLQDPSWMIRSASLKIVAAFDQSETARKFQPTVFKALRDPALVVRAEAISTLEKLKTPGLEEALFESLEEPTNYHKGVAQWVPQRALQALVKLPLASKEAARIRLDRLNRIMANDQLKDADFKRQLAAATQLFRKTTL
jgi:HEAT repeat protein